MGSFFPAKGRRPKTRHLEFAMYLAVLPEYRQACITVIDETFGDRIKYFVCDAHLDQTVRTGVSSKNLRRTRIRRLTRNRAYLQTGNWIDATRADNLVVDLNPRALSAWALLVGRRILRKRTLVWGHLNPQAGAGAATAKLRRAMRRISSGTILYSYRDEAQARQELPSQPTWVAPNSLYRRSDIEYTSSGKRTSAIYVGRLTPKKKIDLAIDALALARIRGHDIPLRIIGTGETEADLRGKAKLLQVDDLVTFEGWIANPKDLAKVYSTALVSLCPGYIGLSLTQSLGFGVPMLTGDNEAHSPEVELEDVGGLLYFQSDSAADLAHQLLLAVSERSVDKYGDQWASHVRDRYSAEAMASGIAVALSGRPGEEFAKMSGAN